MHRYSLSLSCALFFRFVVSFFKEYISTQHILTFLTPTRGRRGGGDYDYSSNKSTTKNINSKHHSFSELLLYFLNLHCIAIIIVIASDGLSVLVPILGIELVLDCKDEE